MSRTSALGSQEPVMNDCCPVRDWFTGKLTLAIGSNRCEAVIRRIASTVRFVAQSTGSSTALPLTPLSARFRASRVSLFSLPLRRNAQCHQKPRHHVVSGNPAGQLHNLRGVEVLAQCVEDLVGDFYIERHLRGVLNHQLTRLVQPAYLQALKNQAHGACIRRLRRSAARRCRCRVRAV